MKHFLKVLALILMAIGTVSLVVLHLYHLTFINILLVLPLCFILVGLLLYIVSVKLESRY